MDYGLSQQTLKEILGHGVLQDHALKYHSNLAFNLFLKHEGL